MKKEREEEKPRIGDDKQEDGGDDSDDGGTLVENGLIKKCDGGPSVDTVTVTNLQTSERAKETVDLSSTGNSGPIDVTTHLEGVPLGVLSGGDSSTAPDSPLSVGTTISMSPTPTSRPSSGAPNVLSSPLSIPTALSSTALHDRPLSPNTGCRPSLSKPFITPPLLSSLFER